jgi:hypothetical protein
MGKDLNLDGAEVSVLKGIGFGGGEITGETLVERCRELGPDELLDALKGLIAMGYVECESALQSAEELKGTAMHINSGYARDLKEAMDPNPRDQPKSRRVRRE